MQPYGITMHHLSVAVLKKKPVSILLKPQLMQKLTLKNTIQIFSFHKFTMKQKIQLIMKGVWWLQNQPCRAPAISAL